MDDNSTMLFGVHKGKKLGNIEESYFLWLKEQEWFWNSPYPDKKALKNYILDNLDDIIKINEYNQKLKND